MKKVILLIALAVFASGCVQQETEDCGELTVPNEQLYDSPEQVFFSSQVSCIQKALETCRPAKLSISTGNSKASFEIVGEGTPLGQWLSIDESRTIAKRDLPTCRVNMKMVEFPSYKDLEGLSALCNWIKNNYIFNNPLGACKGELIEGYKTHEQLYIDQYEFMLSTFTPNCERAPCWNAMLKNCSPALMQEGEGYAQIMGEHEGKCLVIKYMIFPEMLETPILTEYCKYENGNLIECDSLRPEITIKEIDPTDPSTWK